MVLSDLNTFKKILFSTLWILVFKKGHLGFFLFFLTQFEYLKSSPKVLETLFLIVLCILKNSLYSIEISSIDSSVTFEKSRGISKFHRQSYAPCKNKNLINFD